MSNAKKPNAPILRPQIAPAASYGATAESGGIDSPRPADSREGSGSVTPVQSDEEGQQLVRAISKDKGGMGKKKFREIWPLCLGLWTA